MSQWQISDQIKRGTFIWDWWQFMRVEMSGSEWLWVAFLPHTLLPRLFNNWSIIKWREILSKQLSCNILLSGDKTECQINANINYNQYYPLPFHARPFTSHRQWMLQEGKVIKLHGTWNNIKCIKVDCSALPIFPTKYEWINGSLSFSHYL